MTSSAAEGLTSLAIIAIVTIICVLAVVSNTLVLMVIAFSKTLRFVTDLFIVNLALSDLLLAGVIMPLKLHQALSGEHEDFYPGGEAACKLVMFLPNVNIVTSISTIVAISFDRYLSIVKHKNITIKQCLAISGSIWVYSIACSSPQLYEYSVYQKFEEEENKTEMACGSHGIPEQFETIYASIIASVCFFLPLIIIFINYGLLARFLFKHSGNSQTAITKHKLRIVKMMITMSGAFILLWTPYFVMFTIEEVTGTDDSSKASSVAHLVKQISVAISSLSNSLIYTLFNSKFRKALKRMFICSRGNKIQPVSSSLHLTMAETIITKS